MNVARCAAALLTALMLMSPATYAADGAPATQAGTVQTTPVQAEQDWQLLLVNPWNKLPEDYTVELKKLPNGLQVDARIYDDLTAMLSDCRKAGLRPLVCSAYRSSETQTRLYNNKIARLRAAGYSKEAAIREAGRWVAVPGTSEHQTGLAVDLVDANMQDLTDEQEKTETQKWLMANSWRYGFIHRYPNDKTDITGIIYEPWHYRYVGKAAAQDIFNRDITLEEYVGKTNQS